ncbi:TPA: hypothetical protein N0F65_002206 [Lagenidium giganteum]|uniref:Crossover junction endonuclease MUS81-like HHH domain-containing protein n=1 Tax=Lagenidium giganteum TaxID=4803 RepID=A0AAV2YMK7_9STRA|nr:TPA: hypothetical protein N0F65_002206 [Lagenidium giganteum]
MKFAQAQQRVSQFMQQCEKENLELPENEYDAVMEVSSALKAAQGKEKEALSALKKKFSKGANKRSHDKDTNDNKKSSQQEQSDEEEMPRHKRVKLAEEIQAEPARCPENQKIVDAFVEYGLTQLDQGHTGKGSTHLRAAREIRNYDKVIKSGMDARDVGFIGQRMAQQVEQVLQQGKVIDDMADQNVSKDYEGNEPPIVKDIRDTPAKRSENQKIVDALADFAEHELHYGNTGKGTSHLRAAREIHNANIVIKSGFQASQEIGFIGDVMADKIDQILTHGKIVRDESSYSSGGGQQRVRGDLAPIVQDLRDNPAKHQENQKIVDRLTEYGDAHLSSGHRGKGISHLRAAKSIRDSDVIIKEPKDAVKIGYVGKNVAHKVQQILEHGNADDDSDYDPAEDEGYEEEEEEGENYSDSKSVPNKVAPIVQEVRAEKAKVAANQALVDALTDFGEQQLKEAHTGRGITYVRAAREIRNTTEEIKSGAQAKKVAIVGDKVAKFIDKVLA